MMLHVHHQEFVLCVCTVLLFCLFSMSEGSIYSSKVLKRNENGPMLLQTNSEQFWNFLNSRSARFRRDTSKTPNVTQFDLVNDTTHNQALIHWSGENSRVVFILTRKKIGPSSSKITESTLWRSTNYGATYVKMTSNFYSNATLKSYFVSPTDKKKVIFVDAYNNSKRIWISLDEGEHYKDIMVPFSVEKIEFHPENSEWLLGYDKLFRTLYCSKTFGSDWMKIHEEVTSERYYWYVKGVDTGPNAQSIVHFEYRNLNLMPHRVFEIKSCYIPDCRETEFQKHFRALEKIDMDSLVVQDDYVFVQKSGAINKLYVSYKRGPYVKARFPFYAGNAQSHFHVVSSDGECVVIGVNHINGLSHLFFSNLQGDTYTQSLSNVRYYNRKTSDNRVYTIDIHEVQGIVGTYVCNVHESDGLGNNITKISWDNGRSWSDITEVRDRAGNLMGGCTGCQLNLHLSMDQTKSGYYMPAIISKKTVPGLIIGHGTFGRTVEDNPSQVLMVISNDNGKTWNAVRNKRHLVVVSDHGAIIVAIEMIFLRPVNKLDFSSDYGKTWTTYTFTQESVNVDGILTEPGENTHYLTLFGHKTYADSWRIFRLDMKPVFAKECKYPQDFENITLPSQVNPDTCHLGLIQQAERMRSSSNCLINTSYKRITVKKQCQCTKKDYECDLGYKLEKEECKMQRDPTAVIDDIGTLLGSRPLLQGGACENGKKNVTSGFRKIPGDKCVKELYDFLYKLVDCGTETTTTPWTTMTKPPGSEIEIKLLNKTAKAKMGENLMFSITGAKDEVVWHIVVPAASPKKLVKPPKSNLTLIPERPGTYTVQVSLEGESKYSNMIMVDFWYPIEKIYLYHPPVVAKNKMYNAVAWIQTTYGIRGNKTLLGEVTYFWDIDSKLTYTRSNQLPNLTHSDAKPAHIKVTAENTVSLQTTSGKVQVKEFVETLVLELKVNPERNAEELNDDDWLEEFRDELLLTLYRIDDVQSIIGKYSLQNDINFFLYVPPADPLRAYIYIVPLKKEDTKENMLKAISEIERSIAYSDFKMLLARDRTVNIEQQYIIDHNGELTIFAAHHDNSPSGGVIAIAVIISVLIVIILVFVVRKMARKMRFDRYLHFRNFRGSSGGDSHIVRNHDRTAIIEEEFIDDDLDTMEHIGNQDATLQFQG